MRQYREVYIPRKEVELNPILTVTGIQGAGKDFLITQARKKGIIHPALGDIHMGSALFAYLQREFPQVQTRDNLKELTIDQMRVGVEGVVDQIIAQQPGILNVHTVVRQADGYGAYHGFLESVRPLSFLYVWTDPARIARQREADTTRKRWVESEKDIAFHQHISLAVTEMIALRTGSKLMTIWNREDNVEENTGKIGDLSQELANYIPGSQIKSGMTIQH